MPAPDTMAIRMPASGASAFSRIGFGNAGYQLTCVLDGMQIATSAIYGMSLMEETF